MITSTHLTKIDVIRLPNPFMRKFGGYSFIEIERESEKICEHPFYWRLKGPSGLIEIGLDTFGTLLSIHVPSISTINVKTYVQPILKSKSYSGVPCFSTDLWKRDEDRYNVRQFYFDEEGDFEIEFAKGILRLSMATDVIAQVIDMPGRISLELNLENRVVSFLIKDLSDSEIKAIDEYINFNTQRRFYL